MSEFPDAIQEKAVKRSALCSALKAAMHRVGKYRLLEAAAFEVELKSQLETVPIGSNGYINWRRCELGQGLLLCLAEAQNWRCCYCHSSLSNVYSPRLPKTMQPTLEHVVPLSRYGRDHPDNMVVACRDCNDRRRNLPIDEFLIQLTNPPPE